MLYPAGKITVCLTSLSPSPIIGRTMTHRGKEKNNSKLTATAIKTTAVVWKCSVCDQMMPLSDMDKLPVRCSNRKTCGRMFRKWE